MTLQNEITMLFEQKSRLFCRDAKLDIFIDLTGDFLNNRDLQRIM